MLKSLLGERRVYASLAVVVAVALTVIGARSQVPLISVVAVLLLAVSVWWLLTPRSSDFARWTSLAISALVFAPLLPEQVAIVFEALALLAPFVLWWRTPKEQRRGTAIVIVVGVIIVLWMLLVLHPNVPDFLTGLQGARKTVLALAGIVLGCALPPRYFTSMERYVVQLLVVAMALSIAVHFWIPELAVLVGRDADQYTSLFGGEPRLEGVFPGPFHAALAGVVVIGWAIVRFREQRVFAAVAMAVSIACVYLTMVRSAYVAIALVMLVALILSRPSRRTVLSLLAAGVGVVVAVAGLAFIGLIDVSPILSIFQAATDGRVLNRFPGYAESLRLFTGSPIIGWGAGSAGDTLGDSFTSPHEHVTSHNLLLKILVEGGLVGVILWIALAIATARALDARAPRGKIAILALVGLLTFGLVGSAVEALPVTYFLFVLVGIAVRDTTASRGAQIASDSGAPVNSVTGRMPRDW